MSSKPRYSKVAHKALEIGGTLLMPIIRQVSLFEIQDLFNLEPIHYYDAILSAFDLYAIHYKVSKKSW
jgi:transposase